MQTRARARARVCVCVREHERARVCEWGRGAACAGWRAALPGITACLNAISQCACSHHTCAHARARARECRVAPHLKEEAKAHHAHAVVLTRAHQCLWPCAAARASAWARARSGESGQRRTEGQPRRGSCVMACCMLHDVYGMLHVPLGLGCVTVGGKRGSQRQLRRRRRCDRQHQR